MPAVHRPMRRPCGPTRPAAARAQLARQELAAQLRSAADATLPVEAEMASESDNTLVRLINSLIEEAVRRNASDIHRDRRRAAPGAGAHARRRRAGAGAGSAGAAALRHRRAHQDHGRPRHLRTPQAAGRQDRLRALRRRRRWSCAWSRADRARLEDVVLRLLGGRKPMALEQIGLADESWPRCAR